MNLGLQDKVILVSGGAKGIGEGIVRVLATEGAIPVVIGRNESDNEKVVSSVKAGEGNVFAVRAELSQTDDCRRAVEATVAKFGRIDGLVNNAGVNDGVNLEHGDTERFLASLRKNLIHYYELAHFALPELKKSRRDRQHWFEGGRDRAGRYIGLRGRERWAKRANSRMGRRTRQVRHPSQRRDRR